MTRSRDLCELSKLKLWTISADKVDEIATKLWAIIKDLKVSASGTQIVAGSKTVHHILPDLLPPIDREYTLNFFYGHKNLINEEETFREIFRNYHMIAKSCEKEITNILDDVNDEHAMKTSFTKIMDNAIVGYGIKSKKKDAPKMNAPNSKKRYSKDSGPNIVVAAPGEEYHGMFADRVRKYVLDKYVIPAQKESHDTVSVRAGDVHNALGFKNRLPLVCSALRSGKFLLMANSSIEETEGPDNSTTTRLLFRLKR